MDINERVANIFLEGGITIAQLAILINSTTRDYLVQNVQEGSEMVDIVEAIDNLMDTYESGRIDEDDMRELMINPILYEESLNTLDALQDGLLSRRDFSYSLQNTDYRTQLDETIEARATNEVDQEEFINNIEQINERFQTEE